MEKKSEKSLHTERVRSRNQLSDAESVHHHLTMHATRTRKIRLEELTAKMRSKEDMYELMDKHCKSRPLIFM
jgi:hypothetical protein